MACIASVSRRIEAVRHVPVPEVRVRVVRDDDGRLESPELPRPARERHNARKGRKRGRDMAECAVSGPCVEDDVAVESGGTGCLRVDDLRADVDRLQVGRSDRAERTSMAGVLSALLRHVQSSAPRRVARLAAQQCCSGRIESKAGRAVRPRTAREPRPAVVSRDNKRWSLYGAPWLQPVATSGESPMARNR